MKSWNAHMLAQRAERIKAEREEYKYDVDPVYPHTITESFIYEVGLATRIGYGPVSILMKSGTMLGPFSFAEYMDFHRIGFAQKEGEGYIEWIVRVEEIAGIKFGK